MIPRHTLNIYDKPAQGSQFLKKYPVTQYKHRILANGGFDTASCILPVSREEGETIYEQYVGNRIAVIVNNPFAPIFEGILTRVTFTQPGVILTRSLDQMGNQVNAVTPVAAAAINTVGGAINNTASQAIYGIKNKQLRIGRTPGGQTIAASIIARALNDAAYPLVSVAVNTGAVQAIIQIEMQGFFHTLDWEATATYTGSKAFRNGATGWIDVMFAGLQNGATFISASTTDLVNNAQTYGGLVDGGTVWQKMLMLAESGNNAAAWIVGVGPYDPTINSRRLYYRPASTTVKYLSKVNYPGMVFTPQNAPVEPYNVRPDGVIQLIDAITGWQGTAVDPRLAYIASVDYNATSGLVTWQSSDNIQIQGALEVNNWHSTTDMRYGERPPNPISQ